LQDDVLTQTWDVIFPGGGSLTSYPMMPLVTKAKVLAFGPLNTLDPAGLTAANPYFFDILPTPNDAGTAFAAYVSKRNPKKIALLYQSDAYGLSTFHAHEAALKKAGIPMVA